jgi:D-alanine-D-alanine ligase
MTMDREKRSLLRRRRIGVLMGGVSDEREISLKTGSSVLGALLDKGYDAVAVDAGRDLPAVLVKKGIEVAFIALHGRYGEDGCVQGLLELMRIPYTGSGVLSSGLAMDKAAAKRMLSCNGIATPPYSVLTRSSRTPGRSLPLVVKPSSQGSAIGVSVVRSRSRLRAAVEEALGYGASAIAEDYIEGRELTVSILDGTLLPVIEIRPKGGLYDYKSKYTSGLTEFVVPAPLAKKAARRVAEAALGAYEALSCSGAARVDMMLARDEPFVLEVNTVPGMTELSLFPMAAREAGIAYPDLVELMLAGAGLNKA